MAVSSHKHVSRAPRRHIARNALPALGLLTLLVAGVAVVQQSSTPVPVPVPSQDLIAASLQQPAEVSRSAERPPIPNEAAAAAEVTGHRFALTSLDLHAAAKDSSPVLATINSGDRVAITGTKQGPWAQVMHNGLPRWVLATKLGKVMPLGISPCASGSSVENGLQPDTTKVHRAVCAQFPQVVRYGGLAGRGEHATGRAIDIMIGSDSALGYAIADFARKHASELGISQVIWHQHIWTVQLAGGGWRPMSNRGGATANHMDHVHVTTYGNAAG